MTLQSGGGDHDQVMCSDALTVIADGRWFTSLDDLGLAGEDTHVGALGFGLPNKDVVFDSTGFLLGEGCCGNWTGQSGGSS